MAHLCENTPLILVGTKTDLRKDEQTRRMLSAQGQTPISSEQGMSVAKEIGAKLVLGDVGLQTYTAAADDPRCRDLDSRVMYRCLGGEEPQ